MTDKYEFFDKNGKLITASEWSKEFSNPHAFRKEVVMNGMTILTKWTGIDMPEYSWLQDHQFSMKSWRPSKKAYIFVSYVWDEDYNIVASKRYTKIEQAYKGHAELIRAMERKDFGVYHIPQIQLEEVNG
jgi:hypothetical protein